MYVSAQSYLNYVVYGELMYEKLSFELDQALRIIASKQEIVFRKPFDKLVIAGFITHKIFGGLMVNSKGWKYLKEHPSNEN